MQTFSLNLPPAPPSKGERQRWAGLSGAAIGMVMAAHARRPEGLSVLVTETSQQAERLARETAFFAASDDGAALRIMEFPDWETLPYDDFSPHQDLVSQRLETLAALPEARATLLIIPVATLLQRLAPRSYLRAHSLRLAVGQEISLDGLRRELESAGYRRVESVYEHGEVAMRGSIMDIFPMGSREPLRVELFDEQVESLRHFDPETQLSQRKINSLALLPAREFPLTEQGIARFRQNFRDSFAIDLRDCQLYDDVSKGIAAPGLEYYLPLFHAELNTLFDYLPDETVLYTLGDISQAAELFWHELGLRYADRQLDPQRPLLMPEKLFMTGAELRDAIRAHPWISLEHGKARRAQHRLPAKVMPELGVEQRREQPLAQFADFLKKLQATPTLLCAESPGRREALLDLLKTIAIQPQVVGGWREFLAHRPPLGIAVAPLEAGLWLQDPPLAVIAESQLFTDYVSQPRRRGRFADNSEFIIKSLTELRVGAPVIHIDHGIGRYKGLQTLTVEDQTTEFLALEYAEGAKLYVPVSALNLVSRYTGADPDQAPLDRLGSEEWQKARSKAARQIVDTAAELLDLYARREARDGAAFSLPQEDYQTFVNGFPFEETEEQRQAIQAVLADLQAKKAMDRLVCGDVGFGKTEVALRAAFVVVHNGCQVALLAPTTLLAQQHYDNFRDRFADWPVNIALMSRFVGGKTHRDNLEKLATGRIDIVIGTHKLLQGQVKYRKLGLLIIDEEHRFGVRQKERIKALRAHLDILTLTATPIPRTLNMALSAIRDLSIITTPPAGRLSVKTFVRQYSRLLVKEAIQRELLRGGQVFYLHNEVRTIERSADALREIAPEARISVAHGQLRENRLERIMSDFYHRRSNVLVCSTIIESGIDVPSANTIIIERADKFGLAQLHQLRGRVGRSHHQAYAYLLIPHPKAMSRDARKRLEAIAAADTLGAGFVLASHDLEIRGAGELLGGEQSGHIQTIGFSLYSEMLAHTVKLMKAGKPPDMSMPLQRGAEVNLRIPALITEDYLPDVHARLMLYKRIANAETEAELGQLKVEMIDRFGLLPQPVRLLFAATSLKLQAQALGIVRIEANALHGRLEFKSDHPLEVQAIVKLVQRQPRVFTFGGAMELKFRHEKEDANDRIAFVEDLLEHLRDAALPAGEARQSS